MRAEFGGLFTLWGWAVCNVGGLLRVGLTEIWDWVQGKSRIAASAVPDSSAEYPAEKPPTPLLDTINYPMHMKNLTVRVRLALCTGTDLSCVFNLDRIPVFA